MKRIKVAVVLPLAAALAFAIAAGQRYVPDTRVSAGGSMEGYAAYLDQRVPELMQRYDIPGASLALVKEGRTVWKQAYGYADREAGRALTADTPLRVQSISKSITACGVMRLAETGAIDPDAPVEQYLKTWQLPPSAYPTEGMTVRRLLSHTAGLPLGDVFAMYAPTDALPSLEESLSGSAIPFREPGAGFSYSNVGYNLLELLIEQVDGRDFAQYMAEEVLEPLGMEHATFVWSDAIRPPLPLGYALDGRAVPAYVYAEKASGGLLATAEDIAAFTIAGMPAYSRQHVLTPAGIAALYAPQARRLGVYSLVFDAYGSGYYIERLADGAYAVAHGGQGSGWMSHFQAVPQTGDALVILTNSQRSWPFIAGLLHSWARWRGFSPPGMTRILLGECVLWSLFGLMLAACLLRTANLIAGISRRRAPPDAATPRPGRPAAPAAIGGCPGAGGRPAVVRLPEISVPQRRFSQRILLAGPGCRCCGRLAVPGIPVPQIPLLSRTMR